MNLQIGGTNYILDVEKAKASGALMLSINGLDRPIKSGDVFVFGLSAMTYGIVTEFGKGFFGLLGMNTPFRHYILRTKNGTEDKATEKELIENLIGWRFAGNITDLSLAAIKQLK